MRKVTLSNSEEIDVKPLTYGQIKKLKDYGFSMIQCGITIENVGEACEAVVEMALGRIDDGMSVTDIRKIFRAVIDETYGSEDEEKNSCPSGPTAQTDPESSAAGNVGPGSE